MQSVNAPEIKARISVSLSNISLRYNQNRKEILKTVFATIT